MYGFLGRRSSGGRSLSAGCNAVPPRQDIDRPDQIGVLAVSALETAELRLCSSVRRFPMPARRALPAGVVRWHEDEETAIPRQLVFELAAKLEPPLIEDRAIQARFGPNVSTRSIAAASRGPGQVAHPQVLDAHHRVVFA